VAAPLEYKALALIRLAQHNRVPGTLEYVALVLGRPVRDTSRTNMRLAYPLSSTKIRCSLLFRERGVIADEKVGSWQSDWQEHPNDNDHRKIADTHSVSERLDAEHSNNVATGGAAGLGRGKKGAETKKGRKQKPKYAQQYV
jgi:hypothetical protein